MGRMAGGVRNSQIQESSTTESANRLSEPDGPDAGISKHVDDSRSTIDHACDISQQTAREATKYERFNRLHHKSDGGWSTIRVEIERRIENVRSFTQMEQNIDAVYTEVVQPKKKVIFGTGIFGKVMSWVAAPRHLRARPHERV